MNTIINRLKSFKYACNGFWILVKDEPNSRIHLSAAVIVIFFGFYFHLSVHEWIAIIFAIGLVIVAEVFNTAIEGVSDFISPGYNDKIKKIKDLAAAGVLVGALAALAIGLIVFIPKIF